MEEIENQINYLESEMDCLTNKVYKYSEYGRYPNENDWLKIISLLNDWSNKRQQVLALESVLSAIITNAKTL